MILTPSAYVNDCSLFCYREGREQRGKRIERQKKKKKNLFSPLKREEEAAVRCPSCLNSGMRGSQP